MLPRCKNTLLSLLFGAAFSHIRTIGLGSAFLLNLIGAG
jgi:hypothetical protein